MRSILPEDRFRAYVEAAERTGAQEDKVWAVFVFEEVEKTSRREGLEHEGVI